MFQVCLGSSIGFVATGLNAQLYRPFRMRLEA